MDVIRLDKETYEGDILIEGYSSMIWTERYRLAGEFQLKTPYIEEMSKKLPVDSLISLRDTKEVMIVEPHIINKNEDGIEELTIKGRTFETFLHQRDLNGNAFGKDLTEIKEDGKTLWVYMSPDYSVVDLAAFYIYNDVVASPFKNMVHYPGGNPEWLPNVQVSDSTNITVAKVPMAIEVWGYKYPKILDVLSRRDLGIRTIRPTSTNAKVLDFDISGNPSRTVHPEVTDLRFDIYNGRDRTKHQTTNPHVVFHDQMGHILNPETLRTKNAYKNVAYVKTRVGMMVFFRDGTPNTVSGIDRRVLLVDATNIPFNVTVPAGKGQAAFDEHVTDRAETALAKYNETVFFSGQASPTSPYRYKTHYNLGDKVTLQGRGGIDETMQVTEYIRTEDAEGERGYPTLTQVG